MACKVTKNTKTNATNEKIKSMARKYIISKLRYRSVVKCLPRMHGALGSSSSITQNRCARMLAIPALRRWKCRLTFLKTYF